MNTLLINIFCSLVIFNAAYRWFLKPILPQLKPCIVGIADFAIVVVLSRVYHAADFMGGSYWIPSFWVPMLIVGHIIIITVLRQMRRKGVSFQS